MFPLFALNGGKADFIVTLNPKDFPKQLLPAQKIRPGESVPTLPAGDNPAGPEAVA
jgi:hypothetical protein